MPNPTVINPNASKYVPNDVDIKINHFVENDKLFIDLEFVFLPFDFRNHSWNLYNNTVGGNSGKNLYTNNEKLNWIKCTIYNYAPFSLYMADEEGRYNSFEETTFTKADNYWNLNGISYTYEHGRDADKNDILERHFKHKAEEYLSSSDEFYKTLFGKSFNFIYAINSNKFFSFNKPNSQPDPFTDFDKVLYNMNEGDPNLLKHNEIWKTPANGKINSNTVKISAVVPVDLNKTWTYAVLFVDPFSREIYKNFIVVEKEQLADKKYAYVYVENSLDVFGDKKRISASCNASNNNLNIKVSKKNENDTDWQGVNPRIVFKMKKVEI